MNRDHDMWPDAAIAFGEQQRRSARPSACELTAQLRAVQAL
jgi:hypothetical protein